MMSKDGKLPVGKMAVKPPFIRDFDHSLGEQAEKSAKTKTEQHPSVQQCSVVESDGERHKREKQEQTRQAQTLKHFWDHQARASRKFHEVSVMANTTTIKTIKNACTCIHHNVHALPQFGYYVLY